MKSAHVRVDMAKCVGHGRCYELAPEIFGEDERGHCRVLLETVPQHLEQEAAPRRKLPRTIQVELLRSRARATDRTSARRSRGRHVCRRRIRL
jgi:ferredoxin